jgi:hypothetical protein
MGIRTAVVRSLVASATAGSVLFGASAATAQPPEDSPANPAAYWNASRRAAAQPRDLVLDERGLAYLRGRNGELTPYGHQTPAAKPGGGGGGDTTGPAISGMDPTNSTIGATYTFKATVTDTSGVRSVSFSIWKGTGTPQTFSATNTGTGGVWSLALQGFTAGDWSWSVTAKDAAGRTGNTSTSPTVGFTVSTGSGGGGGGGGGDVVTNAAWPASKAGTVKNAAGRLYFEMPSNARQTRWVGYVCSGTTIVDGETGRSLVLTAGHCVYDDANKAFARNVLFIPDQADTTAAGTDRDCSNDPYGCWIPSFGVVDRNYSSRTFPANSPWDYGYYVVSVSGAHTSGLNAPPSDTLEDLSAQPVNFTPAPAVGNPASALGYSYSDDPKFMYCQDALGTESGGDFWLGSCGLTGGSSGGPWLQPAGDGNANVFSVNSWGYTNQPGMAGPRLAGTSAQCVFTEATTATANTAKTCP